MENSYDFFFRQDIAHRVGCGSKVEVAKEFSTLSREILERAYSAADFEKKSRMTQQHSHEWKPSRGGGEKGNKYGKGGEKGNKYGKSSWAWEPAICRSFKKTGKCSYGSDCYYSHIVKRPHSPISDSGHREHKDRKRSTSQEKKRKRSRERDRG